MDWFHNLLPFSNASHDLPAVAIVLNQCAMLTHIQFGIVCNNTIQCHCRNVIYYVYESKITLVC